MNYPNFCKLLLAEVETVNKRKGITAAMKPTVANVKALWVLYIRLRKRKIKSIISDERKSYEVKQ